MSNIRNTDKSVKKDGRGGKREGAGRKPKYIGGPVVTVAFCATREQKEQLDQICKTKKMTRGEVIFNALGISIETKE